MKKAHSFHIPVMGIGFTIDSPLKVAQYGIDSVISLVDDILLEKLRKMYCELHEMPYKEITDKIEDFRAKRITSYLNLMNTLTERKFEELKDTTINKGHGLKQYVSMLPDGSAIKKEFKHLSEKFNIHEAGNWIKDHLTRGSIDVNIMTKVDKINYRKGEKLPSEYNDAHAALRGFAESDLESSVILSAGMNPRLYGYIENFEDFYPDENGGLKKKIVLKVSDFRSAMIQGKFLAKKGLWVSEYRIESGLNCGGHAFATDGYLLGPVLQEFKERRDELIASTHAVLVQSLQNKNKTVPQNELSLKITAQGGVGTAEEHQFLIDTYELDSVGWGTPFLLVPEATTVDTATLEKLMGAKEEDLYLSNISPLGVPFNSLRGNTKDVEKAALIAKGRPGSSCPRKYVSLNHEFTEKDICVASRQYQHLKIKELEGKDLPKEEYRNQYEKIVEKSCICVGLGTSVLLENNMDTRVEGKGVSVCPGPNMAYFSKLMSLKQITDHIYGRDNVISDVERPNMFVKELSLYIDHLKDKIGEIKEVVNKKQENYFATFVKNLNEGITYYESLFNASTEVFKETKGQVLEELENSRGKLQFLDFEIRKLVSLQGVV
ncbi:hypothetical protein [Maribacter polysaccharolyticus]|uniref:hypothetical protein n=1 Tax=Maribacter polysaccharolyticus TaxID=3020831 RepID=UPI00237F1720|nr:hypothetical protein [Maribacter polysaccharolyticus]MDE3741642.1 hypothetical protein [Maribacter polysaccharolyticus]